MFDGEQQNGFGWAWFCIHRDAIVALKLLRIKVSLQWDIDGNVSSEMDIIGSEYCLPLLKSFEWGRWIFVAAKVVSRWFQLEALE